MAAGALVRLVGCQAVRPVGVRWAASRVRMGSERAGAGAEWSLHLCCIKGLHRRRRTLTPRNTARGPRHTGPAQGKHPLTPPTRQHSPHRESSYEGRGAKTGGSDHDEMVGGSRGTETEGPKGPFARSSLRPLVES